MGTFKVSLIDGWFLSCPELLFDAFSDQTPSNAEESSTALPSIWIFMTA
jgi:hypothetical protein